MAETDYDHYNEKLLGHVVGRFSSRPLAGPSAAIRVCWVIVVFTWRPSSSSSSSSHPSDCLCHRRKQLERGCRSLRCRGLIVIIIITVVVVIIMGGSQLEVLSTFVLMPRCWLPCCPSFFCGRAVGYLLSEVCVLVSKSPPPGYGQNDGQTDNAILLLVLPLIISICFLADLAESGLLERVVAVIRLSGRILLLWKKYCCWCFVSNHLLVTCYGLMNFLIALFETSSLLWPYGYCKEPAGKLNKSRVIQLWLFRTSNVHFNQNRWMPFRDSDGDCQCRYAVSEH